MPLYSFLQRIRSKSARRKRIAARPAHKPLFVEILEARELLAFAVNSLLDASAIDLTTGWTDTSGTITMRSAMQAANHIGGNQIINFNIAGTGPFIIQPGSALPELEEDNITVNGFLQGGIVIDGSSAVGADGLVINASDCTIQGVTIRDFDGAGIKIAGGGADVLVLEISFSFDAETSSELDSINGAAPVSGLETLNSAHGNIIEGNVIVGNIEHGILIDHASANTIRDNTITGTTAGPGIEIVGSGDADIDNNIQFVNNNLTIDGEIVTITNDANRNKIVDNTIAANAEDGVLIDGASYNWIGGTAAGDANTITDNLGNGIQIKGRVDQIYQDNEEVTNGRQMPDPPVQAPQQSGGNGASVSLAAQFPSVLGVGVNFSNAAQAQLSAIEGIHVASIGAIPTSNFIQRNYIGTNASADADLGNLQNGILVKPEARLTVIGDESMTVPTGSVAMVAGNVIADNGQNAILIEGNPLNATELEEPADSYANFAAGMFDMNNDFENNIPVFELIPTIIAGNSIGLDPNGAVALGNAGNGIWLAYSRAFVINNTIAASGGDGLEIFGTPQFALYIPSADAYGLPDLDFNSLIQGNRVGVGWDGSQFEDGEGTSLGNDGDGILLADGAQFNFIGAIPDPNVIGQELAARQGNVLSNNDDWGLRIHGSGVFHAQGPSAWAQVDPFRFPNGLDHAYGTLANVAAGNLIGTNVGGTLARGNKLGGVLIDNAAAFTVIGGPFNSMAEHWYANVISANGVFDANGNPDADDRPGVKISGPGTVVTVVGGNFIGLAHNRQTGLANAALGNSGPGVWIADQATAVNIGGDGTYAASGSRNYIAANNGPGVLVENAYDLGLAVNRNPAPGYSIGDFDDYTVVRSISDHVISELGTYFTNEIDNCWIGLGRGAVTGVDAHDDPIYEAVPLGNRGDGVKIVDSSNTLLGGFHPAWTTNTIAANLGNGVTITGTSGNNKAWLNYVIQNNIGTDPTGTVGGAAFANVGDVGNASDGDGILIEGTATHNVIQGAGYRQRKYDGIVEFAFDMRLTDGDIDAMKTAFNEGENGNVISNNAANGIRIDGAANNIIGGGNFIGTNLGEVIALPNAANGILITGGAQGNLVVPWAQIDVINTYDRNPNNFSTNPHNPANWSYTSKASVIANNAGGGIKIEGAGTSGNIVSGSNANLPIPIFTTELLAAPNEITNNAGGGVVLVNAASNNTIDGTISGAGNVITDNGVSLTSFFDGVWLNEQDVVLIGGTTGDDEILLVSYSGTFDIDNDGIILSYITNPALVSIVAQGYDGDDRIDAQGLEVPKIEIHGGLGDDTIFGGNASGRSVLIGGAGADTFHETGWGEHVLITGEINLAGEAYDDVIAEWFTVGTGHAFDERVDNLDGAGLLLAGETVLDDGEKDIIINEKLNYPWWPAFVGRTWYFLGLRDDEYHSDDAPASSEVFTNISPVIVAATYSSTPTEHVTFTLDAGAAVRYDDDDDMVRSLATDLGYTIYSYHLDWDFQNGFEDTLPGGSSGGDIADFQSDINEIFLATIQVVGSSTSARAMTTLFVVGTANNDTMNVGQTLQNNEELTYVMGSGFTPWTTSELLDSVAVFGLEGNDGFEFHKTVVEFTTIVDAGAGDDSIFILDGSLNDYFASAGEGSDEVWLVSGYHTRVTMLGGAGNDELFVIEGDFTNAIIDAGDDDDIVVNFATGATAMTASGGNGKDTIIGGAGDDSLDGGAGDDLLIGGLLVGDGHDTVLGGDGDDVLVGGDGGDSLDAGGGEDLVITGWLSEEMYGEEQVPGCIQVYLEWLESGTVQDRMERLQGLEQPIEINAAFYLEVGDTVLNDECIDTILAGEDEADGVFYDIDFDDFRDREVELDVVVDIGD